MSTICKEPPTIGPGQPWFIRIRGWVFAIFLFLSSFLGAVYIITPMIPLLFWNPVLWRKFMDRLVGIWCIMPGALLTYIFGANISIGGDMIEHHEPGLIIMNHRTRLDWLYFWRALYRMNPWLCVSEKIALKGILKYVPGAGWAMGANSYIFLDRSYESDAARLDTMLDYYANCGLNYQLLLFPEGTDKCPKATERSRIYAEKKGIPHYSYVLHPRTTGFVHIVQRMRKDNNIKYLYDVTIGFGDCIVQRDVDIVAYGVCSREVHYQVVKYNINDLPKSDDGLATWLINLWKEKEIKLDEFYSKTGIERKFDCGTKTYKDTPEATQVEIMILGFWLFTTAFWLLALFQVQFMLYFCVLTCIMYGLIQYFYGGIEWLTIQKFNEHKIASTVPVPLSPVNGRMLPTASSDSE
ncbi:unnamed protein product [Auanema sp. JU1783]|nr:unnamed protein product [Auanema sp. JU1783]